MEFRGKTRRNVIKQRFLIAAIYGSIAVLAVFFKARTFMTFSAELGLGGSGKNWYNADSVCLVHNCFR